MSGTVSISFLTPGNAEAIFPAIYKHSPDFPLSYLSDKTIYFPDVNNLNTQVNNNKVVI